MLDATSSTHDVVAGIDLSGRRVLVTGGAGGLGFATAEALATAGASVAIADHNADRAREAVRRINETVGTVRAQAYAVDLASIASVRAFADNVSDARFDTLVNNAGIVRPTLARTAEGFELTLATNYLGHFLLTGLLMAGLLDHPTPRVVNLSSGAHRDSPVVFEDPFYERRPYDAREAYAQSKSATALFTLALDRRFGDAGLLAVTVRPAKSDTGIFAALTDEHRGAFSTRVKARQAGAPVDIAAATSVWACVAPTPPLSACGLPLRVRCRRHARSTGCGQRGGAVDLRHRRGRPAMGHVRDGGRRGVRSGSDQQAAGHHRPAVARTGRP